jgi:hypothetical protein
VPVGWEKPALRLKATDPLDRNVAEAIRFAESVLRRAA